MAKGSQFERDFCRQLSLWWTDGERDDIFWRTAGSGGRATVRGKKGQKTKNQCGDICATDPIGQPFLDMFTVELKRGYNKYTLADLLDKPKKAALQMWEKWILQARKSQEAAGSRYWLIVARRDKHEAIAVFPTLAYDQLDKYVDFIDTPQLSLIFFMENKGSEQIEAMPLDHFLEAFSSEEVKIYLEKVKRR